MRYLMISAVAAFSFSGGDALAQDQPLTVGPRPSWAVPSELLAVPADAAGLIFVRRQDSLVRLDDAGQWVYTDQVIRILHPQALQLGNLGITWNPTVGAPIIHAVRIHRDGTVIDVLDQAEFEIVRQEEQLEAAMLHGLLTAALRVPDLRVGDELEIAHTVPGHDATLKSQSSGLLFLTSAPPPGRFRLSLTWDKGQEPRIRMTPDLAPFAEREGSSLDIRLDDPAVIAPPKDSPPRFHWQRILEYSDFNSWADVANTFDALFGEASKLERESPIEAEAARIATAHPSQLARAQAALELVQRQVRYVYVGLGGGNLTPATADETWRRRYGDCKGKTALLLALLAQLGISSEAVLVNNAGGDDGLDERLPNPGLFDHVLVRARIDGQTYWLDGTLPVVATLSVRPIVPYRWVLPVQASGAALEAIPFEPYHLPQEMGLHEIDARAGFDKPAIIKHTTVSRGIEGLVDYMRYSALTPEQLTTALRTALDGTAGWDSIAKVRYRYDRPTQASILSIEGTGPVDWDGPDDGEYQLSLPGGGFSPPERRQRPVDQNGAAPFYAEPQYSCHATTLRVPEGTSMENWGFNSVFDTQLYGRVYYRMMEKRDDGTVRLVRGSRTEIPEITAEMARRDNDRLDDFDNSKANVTYDPARTLTPWGQLNPVPAIDEVDWTGVQAPCLPGDLIPDD